MSKSFKSILSGILILVLLFCFISCKEDEKPVNAGGENVNEIVENIDTPEQKGEESIKEQIPPKPLYINSLTGLECDEKTVNARPVAVMLNNLKQAMPQHAISDADIVYEVLEEGGITRLMGVFRDYEDISVIGSIRSARDYYIDLSDAHDAIYVHCGGSTYAKDRIAKLKTEDIDGMFMGNFYRDKERLKTKAYEHTLMITGEGLKKNIEIKGYRTESSFEQPLRFFENDTDIEGINANSIEIPFSLALEEYPYAMSTLEYDENKKTYLKGQYGTTHIDGNTGAQVEFKNIITLECEQHIIPGDEYGCLAVDFTGEGKGLYATNGNIKEIVWKKSDRQSTYKLYEKDGVTELLINAGKSYIAIVPEGTNVRYN